MTASSPAPASRRWARRSAARKSPACSPARRSPTKPAPRPSGCWPPDRHYLDSRGTVPPSARCCTITQEWVMEIIKLPVGHVAAEDTDCIRIQQLPAGTFELNGSVLASCGDAESFESVSMVASDPYPTLDAAES